MVDEGFNRLRLEHLDAALGRFKALSARGRPSPGWLKVIREALGRTERQQAARVGISGPSLHKAEASEADEKITLGQLRRLADALDCELVYVLVPRTPLLEQVEQQALKLAQQDVLGTAHSASLSGKAPSESAVRSSIREQQASYLRGRLARLWD